MEPLELQVLLELRVQAELREQEVHLEPLELQEPEVHLELAEQADLAVRQELLLLCLTVQQELLELQRYQMDLFIYNMGQELQEHRVLPELVALRAPAEVVERQERVVLREQLAQAVLE